MKKRPGILRKRQKKLDRFVQKKVIKMANLSGNKQTNETVIVMLIIDRSLSAAAESFI